MIEWGNDSFMCICGNRNNKNGYNSPPSCFLTIEVRELGLGFTRVFDGWVVIGQECQAYDTWYTRGWHLGVVSASVCRLLLIGPVGATSASCAHVFWLISRCKDDVINYVANFIARNRSPKVSLCFVVANFCHLAIFVLSKSSFSSKKQNSKFIPSNIPFSSKIQFFILSNILFSNFKKLFSNNPSL